VFSAVNQADFSWRNRITGWEGALQITAEHPWFGAGWNRPEVLYEHYYLRPKLDESKAIEMNDYLMLGATLGIPALFCFGMYVWLSLTGGAGRGAIQVRNSETSASSVEPCGVRNLGKEEAARQNEERDWEELEWLKTTCRAGRLCCWLDFGLMAVCSNWPQLQPSGFYWSWGAWRTMVDSRAVSRQGSRSY
jgi:hypothetical protein